VSTYLNVAIPDCHRLNTSGMQHAPKEGFGITVVETVFSACLARFGAFPPCGPYFNPT
jgi:hypothetical protein